MKAIIRKIILDMLPPVLNRLIKKILYKLNILKIEKEQFNPVCNPRFVNSFSQYTEDLVIDGILSGQKKGFYVDIGANDPDEINNTKRFHQRGWTGINIEPSPEKIKLFNKKRPKDINLNIGIGSKKNTLEFYVMSADTLSSFEKEKAIEQGRGHGAELVSTILIDVDTLKNVFDKNIIKKKKTIDFMSVDVEGFELEVLKSNDWKKYTPRVIMIEININTESVVNFLLELDYILVYSNGTNGIFVHRKYNLI